MATVTEPEMRNERSGLPLDSTGLHEPELLDQGLALNEDSAGGLAVSVRDVTGEADSFQPANARHEKLFNGICWPITAWLILIHVGVLAAPFTFTWQALVLTLFLHWLTGGIGICLGYHRLLTHGSFKTYAPIRWLLGILGSLAGEGSPADWVANHRKHHAHSDEDGDPHTPNDGAWWSHVFWIVWTISGPVRTRHIQRWAPDVLNDRGLALMNIWFIPLNVLFGVSLFYAGYWLGGLPMAISFLVWCMFTRLAFVMHSTWFVNSASHIWGYRNYATKDNSRNLWWVALLTYGEGWHNNHHAYPSMAKHGHRWWEIDTTFWVIRLMRRLGLAWRVVDYKQRHEQTA